MWFGTQDGLNRYDGYTFKIYNYKPGDSGSISNNYIYSIVEDSNRMLWLGTREGLNCFDPRTETFFSYHAGPDGAGALSHNYARVLYLDRRGVLWIGTFGGGLNRFDAETRTFVHYPAKPGDPHGLSHNSIFSITEDQKGNLWIGTVGGGLNRFNPETGRFTHYRHVPGAPNSLSSDNITCTTVTGSGKDEEIWIGTFDGGLNRFNPAGNRFTVYRKKEGDPGSISSDTVNSILPTPGGELLVGTADGLNRFSDVSGRFIHYKSNPGNPRSISGNRVLSIFQNRFGDTWVGTANNGISRFASQGKAFVTYRGEHGNRRSLNNNNIQAVYEDKKDPAILWVGTRGGGLNRVNREKNTFEFYKNEPGNPHSLSHNEVKAVYRDSSGKLWVGTYGGGLNRFIGERDQFVRYTMPQDAHGVPECDYIGCIFEDSANLLWIGTLDGGLKQYDRQLDQLRCFCGPPGDPNSLSNYRIRAICESIKNPDILWIGTDGGGLNRFDKTAFRFTVYNHKPGDPGSLSQDIVMSLHQDRDGILWIGTAGGGLNRFDPDTGQFTFFTDKDGLPNNTVYSILEEKNGCLWLGTNRGLSKFNPLDRSFKNYDVKDGLQSNEFNHGAAFKSKRGEIFFGGVNGLNAFFPDKIHDNPHKPPIVITDLKVFNISVPIGHRANGRFLLEKSITETETVTLSHDDHVFSFEYAALNYELPEKNSYAYIMEGFEKEWNYVDTRRFATYTNVPPGNYTFRVKGTNNDGVWNHTGRWLKIIIPPPFWRTWWFAVLSVLLIVSTVLFLYRRRVQKEKAVKKYLENEVTKRTMELEKTNEMNTRLLGELQETLRNLEEARKREAQERRVAEEANLAKGQFLARMSHEIRTPMNGVIGFIDMLVDTNLSDEQADYVKSIHSSGQSLLTLINDILDFSRIEAGQLLLEMVDFDPEVTAFGVCDIIRPRLGHKPVEIICRIDPQVPAYVRSDPGRFRQVLLNLMGNAVKFTETGEIEISLSVQKEDGDRLQLCTTVRDTGIGIPRKKRDSIFEVFHQADGSITRQYGGTGLGLSICKQIAHLMDGDVRVESEEGKGSTFYFNSWMKKSRKDSPQRHKRENLNNKKILVIDDNINNLDVLTIMLKQVGIRVTALSSGEKAASVIQKAVDTNDPFDAGIIDILMPVSDGFEVAKGIRKMPPPASEIPLLAFSSSMVRRTTYFKKMGFNAFLPKPIQRQKLMDMLARLVDKAHGRTDKDKENTIITQHSLIDEAKHSTRILLAEDNALNQKLARYMLTRAGYHLEIVPDGKEAVDRYTSHPDQYDLILMDIQMPEMDGKKATRIIREKGFKDIPIIALTAQSMKGDREKCLDAGMNDYISKPIRRDEVYQMVQKWALKQKK